MSIPLLLARLVATGHCTIEDLDQPSWGWKENRKAAHRLAVSHGLTPAPHRNLLREWIAENPVQWQELQALHAKPAPAQEVSF